MHRLKGPTVEEIPVNVFVLACVDMFSCVGWIGSVSFILLLIQDASSDVLTPAHALLSKWVILDMFWHEGLLYSYSALRAQEKYDLLFLSTLTCFFLSICQVIWTGCVVSHSLEWVLLIDWRLFPSYALRQNCWHIWPISSAWSGDFSLSPSRMTSSCVTSRQCVLCCVRFV